MISEKTLNYISIFFGLALTAYVAQDLHYNPRWYGDSGPGVGKTPREVVAGFVELNYGQGQPAEAEKMYFTKKTVDVTPKAAYRGDAGPQKFRTRQVVAEGLNVAVHLCVEATGGKPAHEVVDMFRTWNGRIAWRKTIAQPLPNDTCDSSSMNKEVDLGLKKAA